MVVSAKGLKLSFKQEGLVQSMDLFSSTLHELLDIDSLQPEKLFIDVAVEFVPKKEGLDVPRTLLWQDCCINEQVKELRTESGVGRTALVTDYSLALLRETKNTTIVPSKTSMWARAGALFIQFYASHKI